MTTSPGLTAVPLGIFSHNGIKAEIKDLTQSIYNEGYTMTGMVVMFK